MRCRLSVLPSLRVHNYVNRLLFGKTYYKINKDMDSAFVFFGRRHRILFHDSVWANMIASAHYPGDNKALLAAEYHIRLDEYCSRNPQFKKNLEKLARTRRKPGKRRTKQDETSSVLEILRILK